MHIEPNNKAQLLHPEHLLHPRNRHSPRIPVARVPPNPIPAKQPLQPTFPHSPLLDPLQNLKPKLETVPNIIKKM